MKSSINADFRLFSLLKELHCYRFWYLQQESSDFNNEEKRKNRHWSNSWIDYDLSCL